MGVVFEVAVNTLHGPAQNAFGRVRAWQHFDLLPLFCQLLWCSMRCTAAEYCCMCRQLPSAATLSPVDNVRILLDTV